MKKHCFLFALFIFLSSLYMQAEGTAGKWSERYNFTDSPNTLEVILTQFVYKVTS